MGHAEMLLAVAGLKKLEVDERIKVLASGDWSAFAPHERVPLLLARQLSKNPQAVWEEDIRVMVRHLGPDRSLDWIFQIGWCNFMTRVADAFQIPLERENVFQPPPSQKAPPEEPPPASGSSPDP